MSNAKPKKPKGRWVQLWTYFELPLLSAGQLMPCPHADIWRWAC